MQPGATCASQVHDPSRRLSDVERALVTRCLARDYSAAEIVQITERAEIVEDCRGCGTFYCRNGAADHWPARVELTARDLDGMSIFCIAFVDAGGLWGADIHRDDGQPWLSGLDTLEFVVA